MLNNADYDEQYDLKAKNISTIFQIQNNEYHLRMYILQQLLVFKSCDIFGQQVNLNYKKQDTYKTSFGGFASIIIIIVLAIFFQSNVVTFFAKTSISATIQTSFSDDPDEVHLDDSNYMIAFAIEQANFTENPYFNVSISQENFTWLDNGTHLFQSQQLNLIPCTFDRFDKVFSKHGVDFKAQYEQIGFDRWLCPDYNYTFKLKGRFANKEFLHIKVSVSDCSNETANNEYLTWKPVCKSKEAVDTFLQHSTVFKIQLYMTNLVMNPTSPANYVQAFLDDELYFTFVNVQYYQTPKHLSRQANIFWRKYDFKTDESLTPFDSVANETYLVRTPTDYRDLTELGTAVDNQYAIFFLRRSTYTENIYREYQKVDSLMSYLGGFLQIMIVFFGFFVQVYNRQSQLVDLSNELFDFDPDDLQDRTEKSQDRTDLNCQQMQRSKTICGKQSSNNNPCSIRSIKRMNESENEVNFMDSKKQIDVKEQLMPLSQLSISNQKLVQKHSSILSQLKVRTGYEYFQSSIGKLFTNTKKLQFSFRFFMQKLFCERMMRNPQILLLNKAVNQINSELDIFGILEKLHEVDKLKDLIFKKPQQIIFNFTPKPLISLKEMKQLPSRKKAMTMKESRKNMDSSLKIGLDQASVRGLQKSEDEIYKESPQYIYTKLFKAYEQIMKLIEKEDENFYLNQQLIKKLGPQISNIFEVSWLLNQQFALEQDANIHERARQLITQSKFSQMKIQQIGSLSESDGELSDRNIEIMFSPKDQDRSNVINRSIGNIRSNI